MGKTRGLALTQRLLDDIHFHKYGIEEIAHYAANNPNGPEYQKFKEHFNRQLRSIPRSRIHKFFKKHESH